MDKKDKLTELQTENQQLKLQLERLQNKILGCKVGKPFSVFVPSDLEYVTGSSEGEVGGLPQFKGFEVFVSRVAFQGWVAQSSPCCAAAVVAGAINGLTCSTCQNQGGESYGTNTAIEDKQFDDQGQITVQQNPAANQTQNNVHTLDNFTLPLSPAHILQVYCYCWSKKLDNSKLELKKLILCSNKNVTVDNQSVDGDIEIVLKKLIEVCGELKGLNSRKTILKYFNLQAHPNTDEGIENENITQASAEIQDVMLDIQQGQQFKINNQQQQDNSYKQHFQFGSNHEQQSQFIKNQLGKNQKQSTQNRTEHEIIFSEHVNKSLNFKSSKDFQQQQQSVDELSEKANNMIKPDLDSKSVDKIQGKKDDDLNFACDGNLSYPEHYCSKLRDSNISQLVDQDCQNFEFKHFIQNQFQQIQEQQQQKTFKNLVCKLVGLSKSYYHLSKHKPSTKPIGNDRLMWATRKAAEILNQDDIIIYRFMGGRKKNWNIVLQKSDNIFKIETQWQKLSEVVKNDNCVVIFHFDNHYGLIFAVRSWKVIKKRSYQRSNKINLGNEKYNINLDGHNYNQHDTMNTGDDNKNDDIATKSSCITTNSTSFHPLLNAQNSSNGSRTEQSFAKQDRSSCVSKKQQYQYEITKQQLSHEKPTQLVGQKQDKNDGENADDDDDDDDACIMYRQVLVSKPGQQPNKWLDFDVVRENILHWSGYGLMVVAKQSDSFLYV